MGGSGRITRAICRLQIDIECEIYDTLYDCKADAELYSTNRNYSHQIYYRHNNIFSIPNNDPQSGLTNTAALIWPAYLPELEEDDALILHAAAVQLLDGSLQLHHRHTTRQRFPLGVRRRGLEVAVDEHEHAAGDDDGRHRSQQRHVELIGLQDLVDLQHRGFRVHLQLLNLDE